MQFNLTKKYKSLDPFNISFPKFTILTGVNGAGKTQILKGIFDGIISIPREGFKVNSIKFVDHSTLKPSDSSIASRRNNMDKIEGLYQYYDHIKRNGQITEEDTLPFSIIDNKQFKVLKTIANKTNKDINNLNIKDIKNYYPIEDGTSFNDLFYQDFARLFKEYSDKYLDNKFNKFLNEVEKVNNVEFLTEEQFISAFGEAPWDILNKILIEAKLNYKMNFPSYLDFDSYFELKLCNTLNNTEIKFSDLSSGEKTIMSMIFALYNSTLDLNFPDILLMDEPDASLHPSMIQKLLDVIINVFVKQKNITVIITTHSPTTVALAPEDSLYLVNKNGGRIEKTSKDSALKVLTAGVPTFSVNYENRRQIFVESRNDVRFYEKIYQKFINQLIPEISLIFISSGESRTDKNGNKIATCEQVVNITKILREAGNKFIWGIIDWDLKNQKQNFVKVLGNGNRYSIENYILDPILIGIFLNREKMLSSQEIGLNNNETYSDIKRFNQDQIQNIVDLVIKKIQNIADGPLIQCELINGMIIKLPQWYLFKNGHELEKLLLETFPNLNNFKRGKEEQLKLEIINKVFDDFPEFVSKDLLEVFKEIQLD